MEDNKLNEKELENGIKKDKKTRDIDTILREVFELEKISPQGGELTRMINEVNEKYNLTEENTHTK